MKVLQINGSPRGPEAYSTQLANAIFAQVVQENQANPELTTQVIDLGQLPVPAADSAFIAARGKKSEERDEYEHATMQPYDAALNDLKAADVVILGAPMFNFNVSSQIKNWMDAVARAGETFEYTNEGPKGLLDGKQVFIAHARGGKYAGTPNDHMTPYLNQFLGFMGLTNVKHFYLEGTAMGEDSLNAEWDKVKAEFEYGLTPAGRAQSVDLYPS